ncbi:MAG: 30S ribosomal protein S18 [Deltaproteobacteria bacterium]
MAYDNNSRPRPTAGGRPQKKFFPKKRFCRFCADTKIKVDYKNYQLLKDFISEKGKITPRRIMGTCAKHQREITVAIKRARSIALLPFALTE